MKGSLIILSFFIVGITIGSIYGLPSGIPWNKVCTIALCALMACVGLSLGSMNPALLLLPPVSILGTLAGCAAASFFTPFSLTENMAVGAGMALAADPHTRTERCRRWSTCPRQAFPAPQAS